MKLAILFWFYKEPQICKNHLELIRRYNATTPIYGLYGGEPEDADKYKSRCCQRIPFFSPDLYLLKKLRIAGLGQVLALLQK